VAPPQFVKLLKKPAWLYSFLIKFERLFVRSSNGVSVITYLFLCLALVCYLIHAIYIKSPVFIIAQSINIAVNGAIFAILLRQGNA
jgi:uncharacterized protein with PQ loop repeat